MRDRAVHSVSCSCPVCLGGRQEQWIRRAFYVVAIAGGLTLAAAVSPESILSVLARAVS